MDEPLQAIDAKSRGSLYFRQNKLDERRKVFEEWRTSKTQFASENSFEHFPWTSSSLFKEGRCPLSALLEIKDNEEFERGVLSRGVLNALIGFDMRSATSDHITNSISFISACVFRSSVLTRTVMSRRLAVFLCRAGRCCNTREADLQILLLLYNLANDSVESERVFISCEFFSVWQDTVLRAHRRSTGDTDVCSLAVSVLLSIVSLGRVEVDVCVVEFLASALTQRPNHSFWKKTLLGAARIVKRSMLPQHLLDIWRELISRKLSTQTLQSAVLKCVTALLPQTDDQWLPVVAGLFRASVDVAEQSAAAAKLLAAALSRFGYTLLASALNCHRAGEIAVRRAFHSGSAGESWLRLLLSLSLHTSCITPGLCVQLLQRRWSSLSPSAQRCLAETASRLWAECCDAQVGAPDVDALGSELKVLHLKASSLS